MLKYAKAVLFDLDGTLVDSMWMWKDIDMEYLGKYGITLPPELQEYIEGMSFSEVSAYFKEAFGIKEKVEDVAIDTFVEAGDKIKIGNGTLEVLHVPGHSPGSIALYDRDGGFVITGDALFQGSVGRTDLPGGNGNTLIKSIRDNLLPLPDSTVVYPGHGPSSTIGREKTANPFLAENPRYRLKF